MSLEIPRQDGRILSSVTGSDRQSLSLNVQAMNSIRSPLPHVNQFTCGRYFVNRFTPCCQSSELPGAENRIPHSSGDLTTENGPQEHVGLPKGNLGVMKSFRQSGLANTAAIGLPPLR